MIRIFRCHETHTCRHVVAIAVAVAVVVAVVSIYLYLKTLILFRYKLPSSRMTKNEELKRLPLGMVAASFKIISLNFRRVIRKTVKALYI